MVDEKNDGSFEGEAKVEEGKHNMDAYADSAKKVEVPDSATGGHDMAVRVKEHPPEYVREDHLPLERQKK